MYEIPLSCTYALSLTEQNAHFLLFLSLRFILNPVQMDPFSFWCICINLKLNNWSVLRLTVLTIVARGYVSSALVISEAVRPALLNGICCKPFSASCLAGVSLIWALWALWKLENCAQNLTNWVRWDVKFPVQLALPFSLGFVSVCLRMGFYWQMFCVCVCARQLYLLEERTRECRCYSGVITGVVQSSWCANYLVALFSPQTRSVAPWIFSELANRIEWSAEQTRYLAFILDHFDPFVSQRNS